VELARTLEAWGVQPPPGTRIHISGCIHACGKHHIAEIGLLGANVRIGEEVVEAVHVFAGGRLGEDGRLAVRVRENVRFEELPDVAAALLGARAATGQETAAGEQMGGADTEVAA
jgi:ferredoxin-nitrite reductase